MPLPFHTATANRGLTLIEILVGISISTLIAAVAFSIYFTFTRSFRALGATAGTEALAAMEVLQADLLSCAQASFSNTPAFEVRPVEPGNGLPACSALEFCSSEPIPGQEESGQISLFYRRYAVAFPGTPSVLARETACLWGPHAMDPPTSNTLMKGIVRFEVNVLVEDRWTNFWRSTTATLCPRAARIDLDWEADGSTGRTSRILFIPAGNGIPAPRRRQAHRAGTETRSKQEQPEPGPTPARQAL